MSTHELREAFRQWHSVLESDGWAVAQEFIEFCEPELQDELRRLAAEFAELQQRLRVTWTGKSIGPYAIEEEIGRGAAGVVWRGRHSETGREVAIKLLLPRATLDRSAFARFQREARVVRQIEHPGVVRLIETGEHEAGPYIVYELVHPVRTLQTELQALREGGEPPPEIFRRMARIVARVAEALDHIHAAGILHRDVKPSNILLAGDDEPRLTDFGLACEPDEPEEDSLTLSGQLLGTPAYMSPELIAAKRIGLDERSDVYSLGVTLYEALTLRLPFTGETRMEVYQQILLADPKSPQAHRTEIPRELAGIAMRAMERNPARRYPSAGAFADDLNRFLEGRSVVGDAGRWRSYLEGKLRRHRRAVVVGGAVLSTIAIVVLAMLLRSADLSARRNSAKAEQAENERNLAELVRVLGQAQANVEQGEWRAALGELGDVPEELRGWEWHHLALAADNTCDAVELEDTALALAPEPDGDGFLCLTSGAITRLDPRGAPRGEPAGAPADAVAFLGAGGDLLAKSASLTLRRVSTDGAAAGPEFRIVSPFAASPTGEVIATGSRERSLLLRDRDGAVVTELPTDVGAIETCGWSGDGRRVAVSGHEGRIEVWDAVPQERLFRIPGRATAVALDHAGARLAVAEPGGDVRVFAVDAGPDSPEHLFTGAVTPVRTLAFRRDGARLAAGCEDGRLLLWDAELPSNVVVVRGGLAAVRSLAVGRGAWAVGDKLGRVRVLEPATANSLATDRAHLGAARHLAYGADGEHLVSAEPLGRVLARRPGGAGTEPKLVLETSLLHLAVSPSDGMLAVVSPIGELTLHGADGGGPADPWGPPPDADWRVQRTAFSPDGARLALLEVRSASPDRTAAWRLRLWERDGGVPALASPASDGYPTSLAHGPRGRIAVGTAEGELSVWDARLERLGVAHVASIEGPALAFDATAERLFAAEYDEVAVLDVDSATLLLRLRSPVDDLTAIAFGPDRSLLTGGEDGSLAIWLASRDVAETLRDAARRRATVAPHVAAAREASADLDEAERRLADAELDEDARALAERLLWARGELTPHDLNVRAWDMVRAPNGSQADYAEGLRFARAAAEGAPEHSNVQQTYGTALYRVGLYAEAVEVLERTDELDRAARGGRGRAPTQAVLALCYAALGDLERAEAALEAAERTNDGTSTSRSLLEEARAAVRDAPR